MTVCPRRQRSEESLEVMTRQPLALDHAPCTVRTRHFENVFGEIHDDRRSIHVSLLLVAWCQPRTCITADSAAE
jgi:hypothetical protein